MMLHLFPKVTFIIFCLKDASKVCKQYMERDPDELRFSLVAVTGQWSLLDVGGYYNIEILLHSLRLDWLQFQIVYWCSVIVGYF